MKKVNGIKLISTLAILAIAGTVGGIHAQASFNKKAALTNDVIKEGLSAESVDLSGLNRIEAKAAVEQRVEEIKLTEIILNAAGGNTVKTTAGELGVVWTNEELLDTALAVGESGDVVTRYKLLKDLEHGGINLDIEIDANKEMIENIIRDYCVGFDKKVVNTSLKKEGDVFTVVDGIPGYSTDVEATVDEIYRFLTEEWDYAPTSIDLVVESVEPQGDEAELSQVRDVLGSFSTSYKSSGAARSTNVANGCRLVNGTTLYPGEEFSTLGTITPFTEANGYQPAGSYSNGMVVDSIGGGICQVSTTLYNAVLRAELSVTERHNHSMIVSYVQPADDAAIAEDAGTDFKFVNNTDYPIYIEGYTTSDKTITFNIYGKETRDAGHTVEFESEVLETTVPEGDNIYAVGGYPVGYISVQSAHTGYKAQLWKIVKENGVETSREVVNTSTYKAVQRVAIVGVDTNNPQAQKDIMAAAGTQDLDTVRAVVAKYTQPRVSESEPEED